MFFTTDTGCLLNATAWECSGPEKRRGGLILFLSHQHRQTSITAARTSTFPEDIAGSPLDDMSSAARSLGLIWTRQGAGWVWLH